MWLAVALQACDGLVVAMVMKFADNIVKGFATSIAIVLTCLVGAYVSDFTLTLQFLLGAAAVVAAVGLYSR